MTSIRAPWRVRPPRDGRDGFDGLPAIDGLPGKDGAPGERGLRGLSVVMREPRDAPADQRIVPWRADYDRDDATRLVWRVRAGPADGAGPRINLYPVRGDDDLIEYVDLIPEPL